MPCRSIDDQISYNGINMFQVYPVLQQPALGLGLEVIQMFLRHDKDNIRLDQTMRRPEE